jgi:hypothetical protein
MSHSLDGPWAKAERAREHTEVLNREWRIFFESHSNRDFLNHSLDGPWHVISASPPLKKPPPLRFSVICGDIVHNLRSALDHLVWQLVIAEGSEPGKWNSFPIYTDSDAFTRDVRCRKKKRGPGPLAGIDPKGDAWAFIEELQPYNSRKLGMDPTHHQLFVLHTLSNTDKHRTLHFQMLFPDDVAIRRLVDWNPAAILLDYRFAHLPMSLKGETEVLRLRFSQTGPTPQVQVHMDGTLTIHPTFGDGTFQPSLAAISNEIPIFIRDIIEYSSQNFFT